MSSFYESQHHRRSRLSASERTQPSIARHRQDFKDCKQILEDLLTPRCTLKPVQDFSQHNCQKTCPDGVLPTSTPTSLIPVNENIKKLIEVIGENQLSVKEMLVGMGLKDRPNFHEYTLSPAMKEGYVRMIYPNSPRHPRQKYQPTVKGLTAYKEIKG